jgi:hypothetical protein
LICFLNMAGQFNNGIYRHVGATGGTGARDQNGKLAFLVSPNFDRDLPLSRQLPGNY